MKKKIVLLGGTFNPIHNTHIAIAKQASEILDADAWFVLAKKPRWKEKILPVTIRLEMLKAALEGQKRMSICDIEIKRKNNVFSYTIDTILELTEKYPKYKFYYLIGTDQLEKLDKWKDIDLISKLVKLVLVNRPNYPINETNKRKYNVDDLGIIGSEVSSTSIRNGVSFDCPKEIMQIIETKGLYLDVMLKNNLSEQRYMHSVSVAKLAKKIAKANKMDANKAYIAGIIHDCAKELSREEAKEMMNKYAPAHFNEPPQLFHQYLAPIIAKTKYGIDDEEILTAIEYHATAKRRMSQLAKVVYCADKTEPGRPYDSSFLIARCLENIDVGYAYVIVDNVDFHRQVKHNAFITKDILDLYDESVDAKMINLIKIIVKTLDDKFAANIKVIDVSSINPLAQYYINCEAVSERQLRAIGEAVEDAACSYRYPIHHIEGKNDSGWVLVDIGGVVVNIFKTSKREEYKLEKLWHELPQYDYEEVLKWKIICG